MDGAPGPPLRHLESKVAARKTVSRICDAVGPRQQQLSTAAVAWLVLRVPIDEGNGVTAVLA